MSRNFRLPYTIELQPLSLTLLKMRKVELNSFTLRSKPVTNRNPDVSQYPLGRHGRPIVPREEWSPLRPICAELGYDFPHAVNSGWAVRVSNWDFTGNGNPHVLVIHNDLVPEFRAMAGGDQEEHEVTILDHLVIYTEAITDADEIYGKAVDEAEAIRNEAIRDAEDVFLDAVQRHQSDHH